MPELPEVETVRRGLSAEIEGKRIAKIQVRHAGLRIPVEHDFTQQLEGHTVRHISRRAKYLLLNMSGGKTLIVHLGMSGSIVLHPAMPNRFEKHDHIIFTFADGMVAFYRDPRRFGLMVVADTKTLASHKLFAHLGPEPLEESWKEGDLYASLQMSKAPVKSVIMNQEVVVGVGNIYACEALFDAKIHPARLSNEVTPKEATALTRAIRNVLQAAIESGGSTLRDYVRSSGDAGYFQHHFKVYGRQKLPCPRCNTPIAVIRQSGRSSFFCPHCQH